MFYHIRIDYYDKKLKKRNQTLFDYDYPDEDTVINNVTSGYVAEATFIFNGLY